MNSQIQDLRAENSRLSDALRSLSALVADKVIGDVTHSKYPSVKGSLSSDGCPAYYSQKRSPYIDNSNIGGNSVHNPNGRGRGTSVCWDDVDANNLPADLQHSERERERELEGSGAGTGTISKGLLLRQLDSIQNQLDAAKKQAQVMGIVRKSSFSKPNPVLADSFRVANAPLSVTFGRPRSFSSQSSPSLSSSMHHMSFPSPTLNGVSLPSHDASSRRPSKVMRDLVIDSEADRGENYDQYWDLNNTRDDNFNSINRVGSDPVEKKKKSSPRFVDVDSESPNGLLLTANRCKDLAQRSPVNTDLSTALDKYLNVVRKLSASAARVDTRNPDINECEEINQSHAQGLQRSTNSNNNSNNNSSNALSTLHTVSNRNLRVKEKQTTWRASEGVKTSPESRIFLGSNECKAGFSE